MSIPAFWSVGPLVEAVEKHIPFDAHLLNGEQVELLSVQALGK